MSKTDKDKLSFRVTMKNAWYAMVLAGQICPNIIVHSFFLWLIGHGEWVFFDGVFMKVVVNAPMLDDDYTILKLNDELLRYEDSHIVH